MGKAAVTKYKKSGNKPEPSEMQRKIADIIGLCDTPSNRVTVIPVASTSQVVQQAAENAGIIPSGSKKRKMSAHQTLIEAEQAMVVEIKGIREDLQEGLKQTNHLLYGIMFELQRANNIRERGLDNDNLADLVFNN